MGGGGICTVTVVVDGPFGPVTMVVIVTSDGRDDGGCPIVLDESGGKDVGTPGTVMVLAVGSSDEAVGLAPGGTLGLPVEMMVDPETIVVNLEVPGDVGAETGGGELGDGAPDCGDPLMLDGPGRAGDDPVVGGGAVTEVIVIPGVTVTSVLNRVGGAMLLCQCVVPLMTEK